VALSPPRLSYAAFCANSSAPAFLDTYARAERLVAEGRPAAILEVQLPLPYVITAAGFVEKYGPDERYNFLSVLSGIRCPLLFTFGSKEVESNMAFQGVPEALFAHEPSPAVEVIPGGDHFYTGLRAELADLIERWLRR
jgi:hypothetical protein